MLDICKPFYPSAARGKSQHLEEIVYCLSYNSLLSLIFASHFIHEQPEENRRTWKNFSTVYHIIRYYP